ncbi:MAG: hypothetical protein GX614_04780 [Sandaracinaceae bacterium]|nr:hypothetical protein [Sandaracinaceae bacterium]
MSQAGCAQDEEKNLRVIVTQGELIEHIAGEPLFREDVDALKNAHQVGDEEALGLGRIYALLAAEARSRDLVDEATLHAARKKALVQMYLEEKHTEAGPLDEAEVNSRYFAYPDDERPAMDTLRAQMRSERTFRLILEEVEALTEEYTPSIDPSRLPAPSELFPSESTP